MMNDALQKLKAPAIGLIITGAFNGVLGLLILLSGLLRAAGVINTNRTQIFTSDAERAGYYFGTTLGYVVGGLSLVLAPIIILGAVKMMNGQKLGFAKTAAILSFIPFSCCFLLGAVFGIWSLVVLSKPDVKAVFSGQGNFPPQGY